MMQVEKDKAESQLEWVRCNYCDADNTSLVYNFDPLGIVKCLSCGLVYTNPRLKLKEVKRVLYGPDYFRSYEASIEESLPSIERFYSYWLNALSMHTMKSQWNICEIGPGLGVFLNQAKLRNHQVYGIELSDYAISYAKRRFGINTIHQGTIEIIDSLSLPKLDVIVMFASIEHLQNPLGTLMKARAALSEHGLVLISTGVWGCFNQIIAGKAWGIIAPEGHLYYFSKKSLKRFLEKVGFEVISLETNGALINELTQNKLLVKAFNNRITQMMRLGFFVQKLRLGDEMFIIARKR